MSRWDQERARYPVRQGFHTPPDTSTKPPTGIKPTRDLRSRTLNTPPRFRDPEKKSLSLNRQPRETEIDGPERVYGNVGLRTLDRPHSFKDRTNGGSFRKPPRAPDEKIGTRTLNRPPKLFNEDASGAASVSKPPRSWESRTNPNNRAQTLGRDGQKPRGRPTIPPQFLAPQQPTNHV